MKMVAATGNQRTGKELAHGSWKCMIERCTSRRHKSYRQYGGRGIMVCRRWSGPHGFINFLADMGERPSQDHSLDRFPDSDGNYEPGNCRWATTEQQNETRSPIRRPNVLTVTSKTGDTQTIQILTSGQVAKILRVAPRTVSKYFDAGILRGWRLPMSKDRRISSDSLEEFLSERGLTLILNDWKSNGIPS